MGVTALGAYAVLACATPHPARPSAEPGRRRSVPNRDSLSRSPFDAEAATATAAAGAEADADTQALAGRASGEDSGGCPAAVANAGSPVASHGRELTATVLAAHRNFRREIRFGIAVLRFLRRVASSFPPYSGFWLVSQAFLDSNERTF